MKTIKQLADEIGVSKQRVYRYIKKHRISEVHHDAGVMQYDDAAEMLIKQYFSGVDHIDDAYHDVHQTASLDAVGDTVNDTLIAMLQRELDVKNEQIRELNARLAESHAALVSANQSLQAAQLLHGGTMRGQLGDGGEEIGGEKAGKEVVSAAKSGGFFKWLFGAKTT